MAMALFELFDSAALRGRERSITARGLRRFTPSVGALALGSLLVASPVCSLAASPGAASPAAATCKFAPAGQINKDLGAEPQLLIDGTCIDPDYNEATFVIDKTEQLTFQVPDGPLIPYTEVTGHFPATKTLATLPPDVRQSPNLFQQNYVFRFPA
jgi:hypothetical protein